MIREWLRLTGTVLETASEIGREIVSEAARAAVGREESPPPEPAGPPRTPGDTDPAAAFARLLEISTRPKQELRGHPAFSSIVEQLSSDEARIVRLFATRPEQPLIHVRAVPRYGLGSTMILENFTLIGHESGCHHPELSPVYLDNLCRLGLLRIHDERASDRELYEILQVHPEVSAVAKRIRNDLGQRVRYDPHLVRLTPFGRRFCETVLPEEAHSPFARS